jgi:hypothetical protein
MYLKNISQHIIFTKTTREKHDLLKYKYFRRPFRIISCFSNKIFENLWHHLDYPIVKYLIIIMTVVMYVVVVK